MTRGLGMAGSRTPQPLYQGKSLMNRNILYAIVGALAVIAAILAYQSYKASQQPSGVQINLNDKGVSITTKK